MKSATCVFDLLNDGPSEVFLYLEPEGAEFALPPGRSVQVQLFGNDRPIEMKHLSDTNGRRMISFWPVNGSFDLFFEGKSIWEQI
jgi:hypothetical protein